LPVALHFPFAEAIREAGVDGISRHLKQIHVSFQTRTIERIVAWAGTAAEPSELTPMYTRQWQQLNQVRQLWDEQILAAEREMAEFLVKTPYILLLSVTGINVVSAARLAGEAGPIEHYASARAINGRAGLFPSRYQSDEVDHADGSLIRQCNRKLRGAAMLVAENLIKCHPYYRGIAELWKQQKVDPRDRCCRIANRAMRMVYQLVAGRQVWRGKGVDREYLLAKLQEFHRNCSITGRAADGNADERRQTGERQPSGTCDRRAAINGRLRRPTAGFDDQRPAPTTSGRCRRPVAGFDD
jgi:hypothetical protein